ncbi:MAG TPA: bifunctional hydroxymethylpyrimidine kinase/phosphomethylpyrimidine kinase [Rudaea sp.]|jgi:hydroxymethylpyrimidine/phosphomethylpyrimidine kinase
MPATLEKPTLNVLTIAGSDSGGCAGIQADLRAFSAQGLHGLSVITAVTAQNTTHVASIHRVPAREVARQLESVFADFRIGAVKIGMLGSATTMLVVADFLAARAARNIVIDPLLLSTSGATLYPRRALARLRAELLPLATLLTPNLPEAEALLGRRIRRADELPQAARDLLDTGTRAVLLKGGHLGGSPVCDVLVDARSTWKFTHPRRSVTVRGTGCALSAAIAGALARGLDLEAAVRFGEKYVQDGMRGAYRPGRSSRHALGRVTPRIANVF